MSHSNQIATQSLHAGHNVNQTSGTRAVPIYQTTGFVFNNSEHAANVFNLSESGYIYSRLNNPTCDILEQRLAALEGGIGGVTTASGTAATTTALLCLLKSGDHIVASSSLYGGSFNLLNVTLPRLGITTTFVDPGDAENFDRAVLENTRVVFVESVGNPKLDVLDLKAIARVARKHKIPFIVDNTVPSPALLRPIEHGANIVIHSLTKYITGNGTTLGGAIIDGGNFDWTNGKFPEFTEPSPGYHGMIYSEAFKNAAYIAKVRVEGLRDFGATLSPFSAFQIIQGLETLEIRIKKHSENTLALAKWLQQREEVAWVNYPGLKESPYYSLAQEYLPNGQSGILTFGMNGGYETAKKVVDNVKIFSLLANFGDTKSLILHPASTTHQQLNLKQQESTGVSQDLIRLSVGLEDFTELTKDLEQAFAEVFKKELI